MKNVTTTEAILLVVLAAFFAALLTCGAVAIVAGVAMLICNWILPMFDIAYPITFQQGCGAGIGFLLVRWLLSPGIAIKKE